MPQTRPDISPKILYLNGERLCRIVAAGAAWVGLRKDELNRINVFPVPDGDTGTNMSLTFRAAAEGLNGLTDRSLPNVAKALSNACIVGARGNSGMILSHFFLCFAEQVGNRMKLRARDLGDILGNSVDTLYSAIENPVEGTMLTVIRESMKRAQEVGREFDDIQLLFEKVHDTAKETLAKTPDMLPALKRANVVDSGGLGFVHFLEGILRYIHGDPIVVPHGHGIGSAGDHPFLEDADLEFQYCTEVVMELPEPLSRQELKRIFHSYGGSLIAITSGRLAKVHIHTNTPDEVFHEAARHGTITHQKVDDMKLQSRRVLSEARASAPGPAQPPSHTGPVAIVTDSTADIPLSVLQGMGVTVVPLHVRFGTESFRDQFEMSPEQFFTKLVSANAHPTTSQPAPQDFIDAYERLSNQPGVKEIISIHISSALSGTFQSAQTAAKRADGQKPVRVFDSGQTSVALGMMVTRAAEMARAGKNAGEIMAMLERAKQRSNIFFTVDTLEYLHKGGRINWAQALLGGLLQFKPILSFQNGKIQSKAKVRGREALLPKVLELLDEAVPKDEPVRFCVVHSRRPEMLGVLTPILKQRFRVASIDCQSIGAVIGAHIGPGAWGIAWQAE